MNRKLIVSRLLLVLVSLIPAFACRGGAKENKVDIFTEAALVKSCVVGETVEYIVTLYSSSPDVADVTVRKTPGFPADLEVAYGAVRNVRPSEVSVKGKTYYSWPVLRCFVTPKQTGKFSIKGGEFVAVLRKGVVVNDYFWGPRRTYTYEEKTADCRDSEIKVNPLPARHRPADFSGCVGDFNIRGWFPPGEIVAGNEAIVVFTVSGFGSLEGLEIPNISAAFSEGCRLRGIEREDEVSQRDGRLFSETTLVCRFIPESETGEIGEFSLVFYNPETETYETVSSLPLSWNGQASRRRDTTPREVFEI